MAGLFGLSIVSGKESPAFLKDLFWGIFYQQHLGQESAGLAIYSSQGFDLKLDGRLISTLQENFLLYRRKGLVRSGLSGFLTGREKGELGIAYCGPDFHQPFLFHSRHGKLILCFTGNLINFQNLKEKFSVPDEISLLAFLINEGETIKEGIEKATEKIIGSFSLLILSKEGVYGYSSDGRWPLVVGKKPGAIALATGSAGFRNFGFELQSTVLPGNLVLLKNGEIKVIGKINKPFLQTKICSFLWVYFGFPNEVFYGIPVDEVRKNLGKSLARKDIEGGFIPDVVFPVPDSGRYHAIGYHQAFIEAILRKEISHLPVYDEILLKYPYATRSFIPTEETERRWEAHIKILHTSSSFFKGKKVVIVDDSIVRGNQFRENLIRKLKEVGVNEIHARIACPEIRSHCPWGKSTQKKELLAVATPSLEARAKYLDVDSLVHNKIEDLIKAIDLPSRFLCLDCYH